MKAAERKALFLRLSSALTGVQAESRPAKPGDLGSLGLTDLYLSKVDEKVGKHVVDHLLEVFREEAEAANDIQAVKQIFQDQEWEARRFPVICRNVIKLWYLGEWHSLEKANEKEVVSSHAYKEGLVWKLMQAHAIGYSMLPFGHWAEAPPPLDQFVTINNE